MKYKKRLLSVPLSAGLLLAGCGTDEQEPPPETEDVELEDKQMEENNNDDTEMQDPGTTDDTELQDPGTEEEAPGEGSTDGTGGDTETNMDRNDEQSEEN
jgi:hypothetical protein